MSQLRQFIILFDIPSEERSFRKKIYRLLTGVGAKKLQVSVWESDRLEELIKIASRIRIIGGKAVVLEKKVIF